MLNNTPAFIAIPSEVIFYAEPLVKRCSGEYMSDLTIAVSLKNNLPYKVTITADSLQIVFKNQSGKIFFIARDSSFADYASILEFDCNQKRILKFNLAIPSKIYQKICDLHQLGIAMKFYPPIGLCCNATQSIWDNVVTSNTPNESVHEENFRFVCPCCGQHLDCEPAYEGVACMCPICSNTIYPQRLIEFITPQTDNYQSAQHTSDFFMEYDDDDEIDWEGITDDMRSYMEVELDSIEYCYIDDMPPKAVEEFENAAEIA